MEQVIVVVGASRGIGQATALALAAPGTHLVLAARDEEKLEPVAAAVRDAGAHATVVSCNVTTEPDVQRLAETAAAINGHIDTLVNSAGLAMISPFDELALSDWESTLRVGLTGTFLACKHVVTAMRSGGLIINIASIAARQGIPNWSAYCAAKYGLLGFSNAIREELRPRGIRVAVVIPAATDTPLWDTLPGEWNRANMLQPADVAHAIAALAAQSPHVTTEELVVGHVAGML
jgi:NAD(P)-dependent dehydrogenase (short-subunit alcohol dehydrogenase family)